jgi:hypothetical protein
MFPYVGELAFPIDFAADNRGNQLVDDGVLESGGEHSLTENEESDEEFL